LMFVLPLSKKKEKAVGAHECPKRIDGRRCLRAISHQSLTGAQKTLRGRLG
jgi:hypothetical protein